MLFKVYAGSIFCGLLIVRGCSGEHEFIDLQGNRIFAYRSVDRVAEYKKLRLRRVL